MTSEEKELLHRCEATLRSLYLYMEDTTLTQHGVDKLLVDLRAVLFSPKDYALVCNSCNIKFSVHGTSRHPDDLACPECRNDYDVVIVEESGSVLYAEEEE